MPDENPAVEPITDERLAEIWQLAEKRLAPSSSRLSMVLLAEEMLAIRSRLDAETARADRAEVRVSNLEDTLQILDGVAATDAARTKAAEKRADDAERLADQWKISCESQTAMAHAESKRAEAYKAVCDSIYFIPYRPLRELIDKARKETGDT